MPLGTGSDIGERYLSVLQDAHLPKTRRLLENHRQIRRHAIRVNVSQLDSVCARCFRIAYAIDRCILTAARRGTGLSQTEPIRRGWSVRRPRDRKVIILFRLVNTEVKPRTARVCA